jgi:intein/homing endonuclease
MQKISNVSVGDKVLGFDMVEKKSSYTMVSNTKTNNNGKRWIEVIFQNDKSIRVTEDHEIYTKNRGWVEAKNLTTEDDVEDIELSI